MTRLGTLALAVCTALAALAAVGAATFELSDWVTLCAAVPAGVGGALLGDRAVAWLIDHGYVRGRS